MDIALQSANKEVGLSWMHMTSSAFLLPRFTVLYLSRGCLNTSSKLLLWTITNNYISNADKYLFHISCNWVYNPWLFYNLTTLSNTIDYTLELTNLKTHNVFLLLMYIKKILMGFCTIFSPLYRLYFRRPSLYDTGRQGDYLQRIGGVQVDWTGTSRQELHFQATVQNCPGTFEHRREGQGHIVLCLRGGTEKWHSRNWEDSRWSQQGQDK